MRPEILHFSEALGPRVHITNSKGPGSQVEVFVASFLLYPVLLLLLEDHSFGETQAGLPICMVLTV